MPPPMSTTSRWCLLLHGDRRRPAVVRRSQAGGLASSIVVAFVLAFLRYPLFNLCLYSDIVAFVDSCVPSYVFEPSRPLACIMMLV